MEKQADFASSLLITAEVGLEPDRTVPGTIMPTDQNAFKTHVARRIPCRCPTARRVIDLFKDVQRHELTTEGRTAVVFMTELTRRQRKILRFLAMPKTYSG